MKKLISTAVLAIASFSAYAATYTVSLGINDYLPGKDENGKEVDLDLLGCVNDAKAMRSVFINKFGVPESNTRIYLDKEVTAERFLDSIKWLTSSTKPGDQIVFTYSGHGAQVEDSSEPDNYEEVLVLADDMLVPGDLFEEIANMFTLNGVNCTFIFDSCFSGGMSRSVDGKISIRNKTMGVIKPKNARALTAVKTGLGATLKAQNRGARTKAEAAWLFASQEDRPSKDISGLEGIEPHGFFTLLLLDMMDADPKSPIRSIYDYVDESIKEINAALVEAGSDMKFEQGPNFEASADRSTLPIILP